MSDFNSANHSDDSESSNASAIERFFRGISECIFHTRMGVADVELVDYVSDLLLRYVRVDSMYRVRSANGQPVSEVFQMLSEAEQRIGLARREVHRHIGDFTLFWSGMYPESLRQVKNESTTDGFLSYCHQGKLAYRIASEIEGGEDRPPCEVLHRLSDQFEMCAYGLREVRRELEQGDGGGGLLIG